MPRPAVATLMSALALAGSGAAHAADGAGGPFADWNVFGTNTLRIDQFDAHGPGSGSPYPFEGPQIYDEFGLSFDRQDRDYARWRGQIFGVLNGNRYRSQDDDIVPERLNLSREVGDVGLPYRWEVGDYFSYASYMTQQRSMKGGQLEVQPRFGNRIDSLVVFAGANEPSWQDFDPHEDVSAGASYLLNSERFGAWGFNTVFNHRDSRARVGELDRNQVVASVNFERGLLLGSEALNFEGEYAHFTGDHDGITTAASGRDRSAKGYFVELTGLSQALPLDYRLRAERYEKDFRPRGTVVTADRRSAEAHAGWRFATGQSLRMRLQHFDDTFQSGNELETRTGGINWSGPLLGAASPDLYGQVDFYLQHRDNVLGTIDLRTYTLSADISKPITAAWYGRIGLFLQDIDDRTVFDADRDTWQLALSADHAFTFGSLSGLVTPGVLVRLERDSRPTSDDFQPTLAFQLSQNRHAVGFNYGVLIQDRLESGTTDVLTHTVTADYRYTRNQHLLGVELNYFGRHPQPGLNTDAWNVGVYWTYTFDRPAARRFAPARGTMPGSARITALDLREIAPGLVLGETIAALDGLGLTGANEQGNVLVYEAPVLREIPQRQRLVLAHSADQIDTAALLIEFDNLGSVDTVQQTFERVRKALIDRYGPPANVFEEGEFGPNFVRDVNAQRFIRITEWQTAQGVLRFGIPRRYDGRVRMELQHRPVFPALRDTLWGLEAVR